MKKLALALVFGALSVGAVSAQTVDKLKVKKDGKEVKAKQETKGKQEVKTKQEVKGDHGRKHEAKSPEERADKMAKRMTEELQLNNAQAAQIRELNLVKAQQMQALKAKNGENKDAMKAEMKQVKANYDASLKNVLTPDQMTKFQAMQEERKAKMKAKHGDHNGNGKHKGQYKNKK